MGKNTTKTIPNTIYCIGYCTEIYWEQQYYPPLVTIPSQRNIYGQSGYWWGSSGVVEDIDKGHQEWKRHLTLCLDYLLT